MDPLSDRIQKAVSSNQSQPKKPPEVSDQTGELLESLHELISKGDVRESLHQLSALVIHLGMESSVEFELLE